MASIEIQIKANAKNAIDNLKATQANINKVGDSLVKLESSMQPGDLQNAFQSYNKLIERAAKAMYEAGNAASFMEAKQKVLNDAIESVARMKGGDISKVSDELKNLAQNAAASITPMQNLGQTTGVLGKFFGEFGTKLASTVKNILIFRTVMNIQNNIINTFKTLMSDSAKAAAESEQIYSKLTTVFGEYSDAMERANTVSTKLGISSQTAASALSTVGDLLQAQGMARGQSLETAAEWVEYFNDIIAFKDIDMSLEEFAQNFMSGAAGNLRNFRTFGSIVKESAVQARLLEKGLTNLSGSELELAKMTTRAEIALEQQKNAIGATQREWDTMLSVQRRFDEVYKTFSENVGNQMEPVVRWWVSLKTGILEALNAQMEYDKYKDGKNGTKWDAGENDLGKATSLTSVVDFNLLARRNLGMASAESEVIDLERLKNYMAIYNDEIENVVEFLSRVEGLRAEEISAATAVAENQKKFVNAAKADNDEIARSIVNMAESADALFESVQTVNGINFVESDWYKSLSSSLEKAMTGGMTSEKLGERLYNQIIDAYTYAFDEAKDDIKELGANTLDLMFGEATEASSIQMRVDAWEALYRVMESSGKFTQGQLKEIHDLWKNENEELEKHNKNLADAAKLDDMLSKGTLGTDYRSQYLAGLRGTTWQTDLDSNGKGFYSKEHAEAYWQQLQKVNEAIKLANGDQDKLNEIAAKNNTEVENMAKYFKWVADEAARTTAELEKQSKLEQYNGSLKDYQTQLSQLYMTDDEKVLDNLKNTLDETTDTELRDAIEATIKAYEKLSSATARKAQEEELQALEAKRQDTISGANATELSYIKQLGQLGMTDYQKAMSDYNTRLKLAEADEELYDAISAEMDAFIALHKATVQLTEDQKNKDLIASYQDSTAGFVKELAQLNMTDAEKTLDDLEKALGNAGEGTDLATAIQENIDAFKELQKAIADQKLATELATISQKAKEQRDKLIAGVGGNTADYQKQKDQIGLTDFQKAMADYEEQLTEAAKNRDKELWDSVMMEKQAYKELYDAQMEYAHDLSVAQQWTSINDRVASSTGFFGGAIATFTDGEGDLLGDIVTVILDLVDKTEGFAELIDTIDQLLDPIIVLLEYLFDTLGRILVPILKVIQPILRELAVALAVVVGAFDILGAAVYDLIENIKHPFGKWEWDRTEQAWKDLNQAVDDIRGTTISMDKKMGKDARFDAYTDMFNSGLINLTEYNGLLQNLAGVNPGTLSTSSASALASGRGAVVYSGDITININGTNLNEQQLENAVRAGLGWSA